MEKCFQEVIIRIAAQGACVVAAVMQPDIQELSSLSILILDKSKSYEQALYFKDLLRLQLFPRLSGSTTTFCAYIICGPTVNEPLEPCTLS